MKIVFDKCVPRPLRGQLPGHEILTAEEMGWGELENGDLIRAAEQQFEAIVTSDQQWKYRQETGDSGSAHQSLGCGAQAGS